VVVNSTRRVVMCATVFLMLVAGSAAHTASATPSSEAAQLATLKSQWDGLLITQKLGTCNAYRRNGNVMIGAAVAQAWGMPVNRKGMTQPGWKRVFTRYFAWACSGAGRSPRP